MKILLIQPKMNKRPMDTDLKTKMSPSLALLSLVALTPDCHEVIVINENTEKIPFDQPADLVGITVTLDVMPRACEIAATYQKRGIPVIAGGIHITCCPQDCRDCFDAICIGPAERVWTKILRDVQNHSLTAQYQDQENFRGEEIVSPAYNYPGSAKYLYTNVVTTSRGCPNRCSFCYNSCTNRLYIRRPISRVIADIQTLGTNHIFFIDDNFIGDPLYTKELLKQLGTMKLIYSAAVSTALVDHPDLLDLLAQTGCQSLFIGFESLNPVALRRVNKNNQVERYRELIEAVHNRGIMVNASLVFGLDGDDIATFRRTLDWLVEMRVETLTSHILTPYPGTALYRDLHQAGRIFDYDLRKYNTAHVVFQPHNLSTEELYRGYLWMYKHFYSFRNIIRRFPRHKKQQIAYLLFNFGYRKFGRLTALLTRLIPLDRLGKLAAKLSYKI